MKKYIYTCFALILCTACEREIDVDLEDGIARLVIEASLDWEKGTLGNEQTIILTESASFYANGVAPATGATVSVTKNDTSTYIFTENEAGVYSTVSFEPELNALYTLEINYKNEIYTGTERLLPVPSINRVEQERINDGFDDNVLALTTFFDDPANETNYYFLKIRETNEPSALARLFTLDDQFGNGEEIFYEHSDTVDLSSDSEVEVQLFNVSRRFYDYINLVIEQIEADGSPFSPIPAPITGNCINTTNNDRFPLGYFRVTQFDKVSLAID